MMKKELNHFLVLKKANLTALVFVLTLFSTPLIAADNAGDGATVTEDTATRNEVISPPLQNTYGRPTRTPKTTPQSTFGKSFNNFIEKIQSLSTVSSNDKLLGATAEQRNKELCTSEFNKQMKKKLKKLTTDSLDDNNRAKDKYLSNLLENQAELSFVKYSRAFINAGYFNRLKGETKADVLKKLEGMLSKIYRTKDEVKKDMSVMQNFFNSVQNPTNGKSPDGFDEISTALAHISQNDETKYHLSRADVLIMNSMVHFSKPGKISEQLNDRLLSQIRNVFNKRNAAKQDLKRGEQVYEGYNAIRNQSSFKSAKNAFVTKARKVITDYVNIIGENCKKYFRDQSGNINFESLSGTDNCSTKNYLKSLFSDEPLNNIETILEYINDNKMEWKGKEYLRVAAVKLTPLTCTISDGEIHLKMNLKNMPREFNTPWELGCKDCTSVKLNNNNLEIEYEDEKIIKFHGETPKSYRLSNSNVNWSATFLTEDCKPVKVEPPVKVDPPVLAEKKKTTETKEDCAPKQMIWSTKSGKCVKDKAPTDVDKSQTPLEVEAANVLAEAKKGCVDINKIWDVKSKECVEEKEEELGKKAVATTEDEVKAEEDCGKKEGYQWNEDDKKCEKEVKIAGSKGDESDDDDDEIAMPQQQSQLNLPQAKQIPIPADSFYIKAGFN